MILKETKMKENKSKRQRKRSVSKKQIQNNDVVSTRDIIVEKDFKVSRVLEGINIEELPFVSSNISERDKRIIATKALGAGWDETAATYKVSKGTISKLISRYSQDYENIKHTHLMELANKSGPGKSDQFLFNSALMNKVGFELQSRLLKGEELKEMSTKDLLKLWEKLQENYERFVENHKIYSGKLKSVFDGTGLMDEKDMDI